MTIFQAIVLGVVQGLTEFLPVSSSGHLVLANYYLGFGKPGEPLPLLYDIVANTGTLCAVLVALRRDVWEALTGFFGGLFSKEARRREGWTLALLVILGSVPTAIIGWALRPVFESLNTPLPVCIALIVTGFILWFTPKSGPKETARELRKRDAIIGGVAQGLAVVPGISRSGTTIAVMLWRGASADLAPRFSFLMYLVASFGVLLLGVGDLREGTLGLGPLLGMFLASFVTGYVAILFLFAILRRGQFRLFAPYLWIVAAITLLTLWLR